MTTQFERDREAAQIAAQREANTATYKDWLGKNLSVRDCIANQKAFEEYMDWADEFTEADLDFALSNMESRLVIDRAPTLDEAKAALIAKITQLISKDGKSLGQTFKVTLDGGSRQAQFSIPRLAVYSVAELAEILDQIIRKRTLEAARTVEVQKIAASNKPTYGYPQLPKQIVRPGTVRAVELNAAYIRNLDVYDLKKLNRLYGTKQVNARLRGEE